MIHFKIVKKDIVQNTDDIEVLEPNNNDTLIKFKQLLFFSLRNDFADDLYNAYHIIFTL